MRKFLKSRIIIIAILVLILLIVLVQQGFIEKKYDIEQKRQELIRYIFKTETLPNEYPDKITFYNDRISKGLAEKHIIYMKNNITSESYFYKSPNNSTKLMIFVSGHFCDVRYCFTEEISYFLNNNYSVLAFSLPSADNNSSHSLHEDLGKYETENFSMVSYFIIPVLSSLNYVLDNNKIDEISMTGISGGGWVTTIYSAIDKRVKKSYPLAGTLPMEYLNEETYGDYEYRLESLYKITDYYDLYLLGSFPKGRSQTQILNLNDECCFQGTIYLKKPYEAMIKSKLKSLGGGNFDVVIINQSWHAYSKEALSIINS